MHLQSTDGGYADAPATEDPGKTSCISLSKTWALILSVDGYALKPLLTISNSQSKVSLARPIFKGTKDESSAHIADPAGLRTATRKITRRSEVNSPPFRELPCEWNEY